MSDDLREPIEPALEVKRANRERLEDGGSEETDPERAMGVLDHMVGRSHSRMASMLFSWKLALAMNNDRIRYK